MTGKLDAIDSDTSKDSGNCSKNSANVSDDSSSSPNSSLKTGVSDSSTAIAIRGDDQLLDAADAPVRPSSQPVAGGSEDSGNWSLVPVHITTEIINASDMRASDTSNNSVRNSSHNVGASSSSNYSSSNSSLDGSYRYYGGGDGGVRSSYNSHSHSTGGPYTGHRQDLASKLSGPSLHPEQMTLNIQKNLEHCAQQQRQQFQNVIRNNNEATQFLSRGSIIIRMRGLPYDCTAKQVVDFFEAGESGIKLMESEDGVLFVRKPDGRATGDAFVMLCQEEDVNKALTKHRELIGSRYIELFRSTAAEVMNRSMDIRHMEQQQQQQAPQLPPLIAQLPSLPPLIPQQAVAHGPRKDCVRLRGLPFEAQIEHVLEFLGEFAKNIIFRGVHMVYTPQGQPSGEAFIQMSSEHAAWNCTQMRHNRYMYFGKKNRYIEVFQCSGDDMNFVLSGGAAAAAATAAASAAARPIVPAPGGSPLLSPYGAYPLAPTATVLSHALSPTSRLTAYAAPPLATPYPMFYWPYPSPPVSPTSGYYSSIPPHTIQIPSECIPMHPGELTIHPGEAVATM